MVLISGAGGGIGRATARRLAAEGGRILAADVNEGALADTVTGLQAEGFDARGFPLDVSDAGACRAAVAACLDHFGRLDVLCNIAGIILWRRVTDMTEAEWQRILAVNLSGVFYLTQAALPALLESGGVVLNMSSAAGLVGQAYTSAYAMTKAGVLSFTKSLAVEYAKEGLRSVALCPGGVITDMARSVELPEGADMALFQKLMPLVPPARPEEIAGAVAYLASDEARFVNGAALSIDGAQTAG